MALNSMNRFELQPATVGDVPYLDILVDGKPLATYFAGRLGSPPGEVSPLGWSSALEEYKQDQFRRFLVEAPSDLPNGRNSILVCQVCGDLACGAYSAVFRRKGDVIQWSEFAYESTLDFEGAEIPVPIRLPEFIFSWEQYQRELIQYLI